jgi:hypothetical protein
LVEGKDRGTAATLSRTLGPLRRAVLHATREAEGLPDLRLLRILVRQQRLELS